MKKSSKPTESKKQTTAAPGSGAPPRGDTRDTQPRELDLNGQRRHFEEATAFFHSGNYQNARQRFLAASEGPNREMAHTARLHISMCEQRLARMAPELKTPEDHYNYAIALINRRELGEAERHLKIASTGLNGADHVLYAMALCRALQGDLAGSADYLSRAIQIDPRNRSLARSDPDFQEACRKPPLRELVYPAS